jgi:hypothetical protein
MAAEKRAFAEGTKRTSHQTRDDIERQLARHKATDFGFITSGQGVTIAFRAQGRSVRFSLPYPDRASFRMGKTGGRWPKPIRRSDSAVEAAWEKETRRLWRSLHACIKARLVAIEDGVETFEEAFFAHIVDPMSNRTMYEVTRAALEQRYDGRDVPLLEGPQ